jgi:hypothetical protein
MKRGWPFSKPSTHIKGLDQGGAHQAGSLHILFEAAFLRRSHSGWGQKLLSGATAFQVR